MRRTLYIFSGLGADERAFQFIDFGMHDPHFIKWVLPVRNETIENYATRISQQITMPSPVLIGLSFGGIMAVEVSKIIFAEKVILISSAKAKNEIPLLYRFAGKLGLHRLLPASLMKHNNFLTNYLFGTGTKAEKQILSAILKDTDAVFLKWAVEKIVRWENETVPLNTFHIHGTKDRILPIRNMNVHAKIHSGEHLMVLNRHKEISHMLQDLLT